MKIKQALKAKNKLVAKLTEELTKVHTYNSIEEGSIRHYDPKTALKLAIDTMNELVELKAKIHRANSKVYEKIFKLAELKSLASKLKTLNCDEGVTKQRYSETSSLKSTEISLTSRDEMVKNIEAEIEQLQEELDFHNAKTSI